MAICNCASCRSISTITQCHKRTLRSIGFQLGRFALPARYLPSKHTQRTMHNLFSFNVAHLSLTSIDDHGNTAVNADGHNHNPC